MKLNIYDTPAETIKMLAGYFVTLSIASIEKNNHFSVALSGGGSPKKLYELLASDDYRNKVEWSKVFFFLGDERYVPLTHKDSNYLMAKQTLFDPLNISEAQVFPVNTSLPADEAAKDYEFILNDFFSEEEIQFDLILLGLGDNAHTASLFPHTSVLHDEKPSVKALFIHEINASRITLNAQLINQAHHIAFLVYGKEKAEAVHHILRGKHDVEQYPAQLITSDDKTEWFLDNEAASQVIK